MTKTTNELPTIKGDYEYLKGLIQNYHFYLKESGVHPIFSEKENIQVLNRLRSRRYAKS